MHTPRKPRSRIETAGIKDLVENMLEANATYDEIKDAVFSQTGTKISVAALSRYRAKWSSAKARLERAGIEAEALVSVLTEHPSGDLVEAGMGMLLGKLVKRFADTEESFETADLMELSVLLNRTARTDQQGKALKLQEERLGLMKEKIAATAESVVSKVQGGGLPVEIIQQIEEEILGLTVSA